MRLLALVVLLMMPLAQASPGHEGPEPAEVVMHIHFAVDDRLPMQPMAPSAFHLPPAAEPVAECASALEWQAVFTQVPVDGDVLWMTELARDAHLGPSRAALSWYVETVRPGTDEPLAIPAPQMRLQAELRAGDGGRLLALAMVDGVPSAVAVEDRFVFRYDATFAWENRTILQAEGLHLTIRLDMGPDACRVAPPGVRAYADAGHTPRLLFDVFEPVRIDRLEAVPGKDWTIVWHASSPWGRFDLQQLEAPAIRGPAGDVPVVLLDASETSVLETVWSWQPGRNGTYRIDAVVRNLAGDEAAASSIFRVGEDAPPAPVEVPDKESPLSALLPFLALVGAIVLAKRNRR